MRPVRIIGGGLAGLALGCALRREGVPVRIDEAGRVPRHRVCGEFLCGRGAEVLVRLGLDEALRDAPEHCHIGWYRRNRRIFESSLPEPARGVSRHRLDGTLAESFVRLGGELRTESRVDPAAATAHPGTLLACGRAPSRSGWIGLKVHCLDLSTRTDLELHLGDHGYAGVSRVEGGRVNVCGLFRPRPDLRARREQLLPRYLEASGLSALAARVKAAQTDPRSRCAVAGAHFAALAPDGPCPRLGDGFGAMPPFTGNGMSLALETAENALPHLYAYAAGKADWETTVACVQADLRRTFQPRLTTAGRLHRWITRPVRQRALAGLAAARLLPFAYLYRRTH